MRRTMIAVLLILFLILIVVGCSGGSYTITVGEINCSVNSISGQYHSFNGSYFKSAKLNQGDFIEFDLTLRTEEGEFSASVIDPEGKTIAQINKDKTVKIPTSGTYKVLITGKDHRGSFILQWNKKLY